MTRHLRQLALTGFTALVLAMSSAPTAEAGMYPYGGWGGYYSSYYGPSWGGYYSSYYSPYYTSYYSPGYDYGYHSWGSYGCCGYSPCNSCCDPCGGCSSCAGGDCAQGCACAPNGGPMRATPDGKASGPSKTFGNGSQDKDWKGTNPPPPGTQPGDKRDYDAPGTTPPGGSAERTEAQKPAADSVEVPQRKEGPTSPPDQQPENPDSTSKPAGGADVKDGKSETAPGPQLNRPDVAKRKLRTLAGLDRKVTSVSTPERVRSQFRWRLADERLVRKTVDPFQGNQGIEVARIVKK